MLDCRFPWVILVPRVIAAEELHDLSAQQSIILTHEISHTSSCLKQYYGINSKINVAALGNIVRQLHVHVVVRYVDDAAWPVGVWGFGERQLYSDDLLAATVLNLKKILFNT